jgi:AraC-like DNA-binding protein
MTAMGGLAIAVAFAFDSEVRQRVHDALAPHAVVRIAGSEAECVRFAQRDKVALIILELSCQTEASVERILHELRNRGPIPRVVGYAAPRQDLTRVVVAAIREGLDEFVYQRVENDILKLRELLSDRRFPLADKLPSLLGAVTPLISSELHLLLRRSLECPTPCETVVQLALQLRMKPAALAASLRRAGGPTPERFRSWCRLFWIALALQTTSWSNERIAHRVNLDSGAAVHHLVKRYLGMTPEELRHAGAVRTVALAFARSCGSGSG